MPLIKIIAMITTLLSSNRPIAIRQLVLVPYLISCFTPSEMRDGSIAELECSIADSRSVWAMQTWKK